MPGAMSPGDRRAGAARPRRVRRVEKRVLGQVGRQVDAAAIATSVSEETSLEPGNGMERVLRKYDAFQSLKFLAPITE